MTTCNSHAAMRARKRDKFTENEYQSGVRRVNTMSLAVRFVAGELPRGAFFASVVFFLVSFVRHSIHPQPHVVGQEKEIL